MGVMEFQGLEIMVLRCDSSIKLMQFVLLWASLCGILRSFLVEI